MRALVTGASGFIGANVCRALLRSGWKIRALLRSTSSTESLDELDVEIRRGDILEPDSLREAAEGSDVVFHTASPFRYWGYEDAEMDRVTITGARNVVEASHTARVKRLVLTSSSVVLGSSTRAEIRTETGVLRDPEAPQYARAKHAQERAVFERADELALDTVAVLPTITVGPHDANLSSSNAIIVNYLKDPWKATWPGGCNVVSVRDVARGHLLAAKLGRRGERYILGSENWRWSQIHGAISDLCTMGGPMLRATYTSAYVLSAFYEAGAWLTGDPPPSTRAQAKMIGRFYWYSHQRAAQELGWKPRPTRWALTDAIGWLAASRHISPDVRRHMLLAQEVYTVRAEAKAAEAP